MLLWRYPEQGLIISKLKFTVSQLPLNPKLQRHPLQILQMKHLKPKLRRQFQAFLQSQLLGFLGTGPRTVKGRPAQTNRDEGPGRGRSKPLRRGDQTKAMTADKRARRRVVDGDDLARSHGLVLPRSRGFRDKQPLERSRATSSVMVLGRRTCLSRWRIYPTSVLFITAYASDIISF
ncbi:hypothetical protein Acr_28g0004110 [Actinidia rufa]|uniref:Uncharacterized protein n=1 Tax=Actinidia rufa TaxID=165716 RepID=A0A7J0H9F3_9ERIC|nr:hypothetical protein Acr_28g0004110 [Actinidia rufa]